MCLRYNDGERREEREEKEARVACNDQCIK